MRPFARLLEIARQQTVLSSNDSLLNITTTAERTGERGRGRGRENERERERERERFLRGSDRHSTSPKLFKRSRVVWPIDVVRDPVKKWKWDCHIKWDTLCDFV
jgi:hypothetical protein